MGSYVYADHFNLFGANGNSWRQRLYAGADRHRTQCFRSAILGPLQNNGGPTQTHALVAGSPAIDAGDPGGCRANPPLSGWHGIVHGYEWDPVGSLGALLSTDQRGFARHVDGNNDGTARCDIGAVEFGAAEFAPGLRPSWTSMATA